MATRTDRVQVIFEVGNDGKLKASLLDVGKGGDAAAAGLDKASAAQARMLSAAKIAGTVLGTGLVAVMGLVIKNTMEAERVDAQLEARLKSTAGAAGMTKQALDDLATATARKTTFDDESVKSAEAMLLTFTKVHADVFPKAIAAITDMATAMGTDLESAALSVGKALQEPVSGMLNLSRMGVQFSADQKQVIKSLVESGRAAEAQLLILRELETEFGGASTAARDTFGGALAALKNTVDDLTEGRGGSLNDATKAVNSLIKTLNDPDVQQGAANITTALFKIGNSAIEAAGKFGMLLGAYQDWLSKQGFVPKDDDLGGLLKNRDKLVAMQQARGGSGLAGANDPLGKLLGVDQKVQGQIDAIDAKIEAAVKASGYTLADIYRVPGTGVPIPFANSFDFAADQRARSASANSGGSAGAGKGGASGGRGSQMPDFYAATVADIQREIEEAARLDDQWKALAATLAGPLAAAQNEHEQNLRQITDLGKAAGASAADIDKAKEQEIARYNQEAEAIRARLDPAQALIQDMQFELQLLGLTNDERAREIALRRAGAAATEEQRAKIDDLLGKLKDGSELDQTKSDLKGLFVDIGMDVGNAEDALDRFFDTLKRRALEALADDLIGKLFPSDDSAASSGSGGGWMSAIGSFFSGIFGGGRATGGSVSGGSLYEVVERNQPEVFEQNGRRYLIPGGPGWVTPAQPIGGGAAGAMPAGSGVTVIVENNGGSPARVEETTGQDGNRVVKVIVDAAVAEVDRRIAGMGSTGRAVQSRFGLAPQGVSRG